MRTSILFVVWFIVCVSALPVHGQEGTRFGLGVGISDAGLNVPVFGDVETLLSPSSFFLPITLASFRVEPEIGYFRTSTTESLDDDEAEASATILQFGVGIFSLNRAGGTVIYYGARVGITRQSASLNFSGEAAPDDVEASSTNFFVGPAVGGDHFLGDHFSLGGEVQVLYTSIGQEDVEEDDAPEVSSSFIRTRAVFLIRWHF